MLDLPQSFEKFRAWVIRERAVTHATAHAHALAAHHILVHLPSLTEEGMREYVTRFCTSASKDALAWSLFYDYCQSMGIDLPVRFPEEATADLPPDVQEAVCTLLDIFAERDIKRFCWCDGEPCPGGWNFGLEDDDLVFFVPADVLAVVQAFDYPNGPALAQPLIRAATVRKALTTRKRTLPSASSGERASLP